MNYRKSPGRAGAKLDELDEALTGEQVDLPMVEHVDGWFRRQLMTAVRDAVEDGRLAQIYGPSGYPYPTPPPHHKFRRWIQE